MREWQVKRRERTRQLIELGGLVVKAGLVELADDDRATLYGAFLTVAAKLRGEELWRRTRRWCCGSGLKGKRAFENFCMLENDGHGPLWALANGNLAHFAQTDEVLHRGVLLCVRPAIAPAAFGQHARHVFRRLSAALRRLPGFLRVISLRGKQRGNSRPLLLAEHVVNAAQLVGRRCGHRRDLGDSRRGVSHLTKTDHPEHCCPQHHANRQDTHPHFSVHRDQNLPSRLMK
jgi:hypothetical protein